MFITLVFYLLVDMDRLMSITTTLGILCSKGPYGSWWVNKQASAKPRWQGSVVFCQLRSTGTGPSAAVSQECRLAQGSVAMTPTLFTSCILENTSVTLAMLRGVQQSYVFFFPLKKNCLKWMLLLQHEPRREMYPLVRLAVISHLRIMVGYSILISHLMETEPFCIKPKWRWFSSASHYTHD